MSGVPQLFLGKSLFYARITGTDISDAGTTDFAGKTANNAGAVFIAVTATAVVKGGEGALTYLWTDVSGDPATFSASTASVTNVTSSYALFPSDGVTGQVKLTVTDAVGNTAVRLMDFDFSNIHA